MLKKTSKYCPAVITSYSIHYTKLYDDKIGCELSRPNELDAMLTLLDQKYAHIDIVYNNAAISCGPQPLFQLNRSLWDEIFEVNVFALIKICEHFLPKMLDNNFGRIINFTSGIADQSYNFV